MKAWGRYAMNTYKLDLGNSVMEEIIVDLKRVIERVKNEGI